MQIRSVDDAFQIILQHTPTLPRVRSSLSGSLLGRYLAEDVNSDLDSPPFTKSLRDGYAVRFHAENSLAPYRVTSEVAAGCSSSVSLKPGEAVRIFTGAIIPAGTDAVVMQEDCVRFQDQITVTKSIALQQWILPQGAEYRSGQAVLPAKTKLRPVEIGLLASLGKSEVTIFSEPIVSVISTGNEIVEPSQIPEGSQIRNSNGPMLMALAQRSGGRSEYFGIVPDDRDLLKNRVNQAISRSDVVIVSGGVSVGDHDHLPKILPELGFTTHLHQVDMKPGKPFLFASRDGKLLFGLPGNPVSAWMCFELFVRSAMDHLQGNTLNNLPWHSVHVAERFSTSNDRPTYFPARYDYSTPIRTVRPNVSMNSANLNSALGAETMMMVPKGRHQFETNDLVQVLDLIR